MTDQEVRFRHIPELDGIRGLAVLLVFVHHAFYAMAPSGAGIVHQIHSFARYGMFGVDVFFVLSGFLITSLLFGDRARPHFYQNFYWKRALRILPLFFVSLAALGIADPHARKYVLLSLLFVVNFANLFHVNPYIGPFWTLAIEEQFYLVWPQLSRAFAARRLQVLAVAIWLGSTLLRLGSTFTHHHNFTQTQFRLDGLALGAALASTVYLHKIQYASIVIRTTWRRRMHLSLLAPGCLILALGVQGESIRIIGRDRGESLVISGVILCTAGLIAHAVATSRSPALALLRTRTLAFFGAISYAFYLTHIYALRLYDRWHGPLQPGDTPALFERALAAFLITVAVCLIARYAIELPAHNLRRHVLQPEPALQKKKPPRPDEQRMAPADMRVPALRSDALPPSGS